MTQIMAADVARYLQQHPDFFHDHIELLEQLSIPHPSGVAVSLVTKQLELLRNKQREQERQLAELIAIAQSNEANCATLHQLTLALLNATALPEAITALQHVLTPDFTDFVEIRLIQSCPVVEWQQWFIEPNSEDVKAFMKELGCRQIRCTRPTLVQARILFVESALEVNSCALVPLSIGETAGILAIASREAGRFHYSKGQAFLQQIGEIVSARLYSLLQQTL